MEAVSIFSRIREMSAEEIQEHADSIYAKCNCDILSLTPQEHKELQSCNTNYQHLTGRTLQPSASHPAFHLC